MNNKQGVEKIWLIPRKSNHDILEPLRNIVEPPHDVLRSIVKPCEEFFSDPAKAVAKEIRRQPHDLWKGRGGLDV